MPAGSRKRPVLTATRAALFLGAALGVSVVDLWSKALAFARLGPGEALEVIHGFFYLRLSRNAGGVFGVGQGRVGFFVAFSLVAVVFILWMFWTQGGHDRLLALGLGLVLGGAVGNLYDRVALNYVRDFLDFRFGGWSYPTFNIADSAICIGVGLLLISSFRKPAEPAPKAETGAPKANGSRPSAG